MAPSHRYHPVVGWIQLVSNLVGDLAWPFAAVAIILIFREPLRGKLSQLTRVRRGDTEAWFEKEAAKIEAETQTVTEELQPGAGSEGDEGIWRQVVSLASSSPRSAVLEAFMQVEQALVQIAGPSRPPQGIVNLARALGKADKIPPGAVSSITELALLRNQAAHASEFPISEKGAVSYVMAAQRVTGMLLALSGTTS
jgi:hypothetical protein